MAGGLDVDGAIQLLHSLEHPPYTSDWRSRWQVACEVIWTALPSSTPFPEEELDRFLRLLVDQDRFSIARLVIPLLRSRTIDAVSDRQQRRILEGTRDIRERFLRGEDFRQSSIDSADFAAEKETFGEAEMHRARLLLHRGGKQDAAWDEKLRKWLAAAPKGV